MPKEGPAIARIDGGDSIFEVGCGAGAFLLPFYRDRHEVGGIDYSAALIEIARSELRGGSFRVCDAASLVLDEAYDVLVANSVFQYFCDLAYARQVVQRMIRGTRRRVVLLDLPDARLEAECEASINDHDLKSYGYSAFRFNVVLEKM